MGTRRRLLLREWLGVFDTELVAVGGQAQVPRSDRDGVNLLPIGVGQEPYWLLG